MKVHGGGEEEKKEEEKEEEDGKQHSCRLCPDQRENYEDNAAT